MAEIEIGLQEAPRCPESINRELRRWDRNLRCVFNIQNRVWQIQERVERTGVWSHVCFWCDGPWNAMQFKQLPGTAEPLLERIMETDMLRRGQRLPGFIKELNSRGASRRAATMDALMHKWRGAMLKYAEWARRRGVAVQRRWMMGGASRAAAIQERLEAIKDAQGRA